MSEELIMSLAQPSADRAQLRFHSPEFVSFQTPIFGAGQFAMVHNSPPSRPARRAKRACRACNQRRVRCNVMEQFPCANCSASKVECELVESKRGKHFQKPRRHQDLAELERPHDEAAVGRTQTEVPSQSCRDPFDAPSVASTSPMATYAEGLPSPFAGAQTRPTCAASVKSDSHHSARTAPSSLRQEDGEVYLGESTSLRLVHDQQTATSPNSSSPRDHARLYYPLPDALKSDAAIPGWEAQRREARLQYLQSSGACSFPSESVCTVLLKAYFQWFHFCFPIVDRQQTISLYQSHNLSPLLLQAMLFVGLMHADEAELQTLGLGNRHDAKYMFYNRAKDLYDADYEPNKLTVLQAVFLMSFWRAGPLWEKNTRHWLGVAITLCQTKAMHRSLGHEDGDQLKLRKRIWWSIYIRDRQCSSALGLPNRIRDEDCDVEFVEASDVRDTNAGPSSPLLCPQLPEHISYFVEMAKLARHLGKVVHKEYLPNANLSGVEKSQLKATLEDWFQHLPMTMQISSSGYEPTSFYVSMIHVTYNNLLILLYRSEFTDNKDGGSGDGQIAVRAACTNTRIIENMLADGTIHHGQLHLITSIFNTLCMQTVILRRSTGTARKVAEHRAKLCLLGLNELQKTWEVTNWVLQLFFQFLDHSIAKHLRMDDEQLLAGAPSSAQGTKISSHSANQSTMSGVPRSVPVSQTAESHRGLDACLRPPSSMQTPSLSFWSPQRDSDSSRSWSQSQPQALADFPFGETSWEQWLIDASPAHFNGLRFQDFDCLANICLDGTFTGATTNKQALRQSAIGPLDSSAAYMQSS